MVGENGTKFYLCWQYVTLEHGTFLHSCRVEDISFRHFLTPWVWVISFDLSSALCHVVMTSDPLMSNTAKSSVVLLICSREVFLCSFQLPSDSLLVLIHYYHVPLSRIDDVGNIMAHLWSGHFLSTSAHYPGIWSIDSLMVPWSLHVSMVGSSHSMQGPHHWPSIEWFYECSMPDHCSHSVDCTSCTLRAIVIIGGFSRTC